MGTPEPVRLTQGVVIDLSESPEGERAVVRYQAADESMRDDRVRNAAAAPFDIGDIVDIHLVHGPDGEHSVWLADGAEPGVSRPPVWVLVVVAVLVLALVLSFLMVVR
ncbi:hypothetical protein ACQBAR_13975 [Propionibacteriaceae bacterium Y1685]